MAARSFTLGPVGRPSSRRCAAAVDLPYARTLIERSVLLDSKLKGGRGLMILGMIDCRIPKLMGGDPKQGMASLDRALELTKRQSYGLLVQQAESCAVALEDRAMFLRLLQETLDGRDVEEYRLENKLAQAKARRLLRQVGELFY